jgi:hypothetical protein
MGSGGFELQNSFPVCTGELLVDEEPIRLDVTFTKARKFPTERVISICQGKRHIVGESPNDFEQCLVG